jgi:hypothetical protein
MNDRLSDAQVAEFEGQHRMHLPADYRWFITNIGNGGAGPYYGVFALGEMDDGFELESWEGGSFVGALHQPFPHTTEWNDLTGKPDDDLAQENEVEFFKQLAKFEERYLCAIDGAIPICHMGCALRIWLVVSGPEAGNIWIDRRADTDGFAPLTNGDAPRIGFLPWWENWLEDALDQGDEA